MFSKYSMIYVTNGKLKGNNPADTELLNDTSPIRWWCQMFKNVCYTTFDIDFNTMITFLDEEHKDKGWEAG